MKGFVTKVRADPSPANCARAGVLIAGAVGMIIGLVIGLQVYAATAWAAMFELGVPAAVVGGVAGFLVGGALALVNRLSAS